MGMENLFAVILIIKIKNVYYINNISFSVYAITSIFIHNVFHQYSNNDFKIA